MAFTRYVTGFIAAAITAQNGAMPRPFNFDPFRAALSWFFHGLNGVDFGHGLVVSLFANCAQTFLGMPYCPNGLV